MITSKPVGTISYNTESYLVSVLDRLVKSRIVCNYWYILHHGENGDKDHYHVRLELAKRYDTSCIRDMFDEPDPTSDKPLGCMPFVYSDLSHWIIYFDLTFQSTMPKLILPIIRRAISESVLNTFINLQSANKSSTSVPDATFRIILFTNYQTIKRYFFHKHTPP